MLHGLSIKQVCRCESTDYLISTYYQVQCVCALKECVVQRVSVTFVVAHLSVGSLPGLLLVFFKKKLTHPMGLCCGWFLLAK